MLSRVGFLLFGFLFHHSSAQVPANGDVAVFAKLVSAKAEEKVALLLADKAKAQVFDALISMMTAEEEGYEQQRLIDVGSLLDISGEPILQNIVGLEQIIDPRTPEGFGDPFFRKIHVELNQEMDIAPAFVEQINATSEVNNTDFDADVFNNIDLDSFVTDSPITHEENIYFTRKNFETQDLSILWNSHLIRRKHENGTDVDRNTTKRCRVVTGKDESCKETFSEYNSYWEAEVDPFPDGVCPNPCDCLRGVISGALKQAIAIQKCKQACAKTDDISIITCADFKTKAERAKQMILIIFNEKAGGWTSGKKVTRNHPLGADVRRFIGVF